MSQEDLVPVLKDLSSQLGKLIRIVESQTKSPLGFEWNDLLALPDHLQKTAIVLGKQGRVTAQDVANITKRARANESLHLNELVHLGLAKKEREKNRKSQAIFTPVISNE